jgi:hypothetical protein
MNATHSTFTKTKAPVVYSQSTIVGIIDDTTGKYVKTAVTKILDEFAAHLKSSGSVGANSWEYMFDCDYSYMPALNIEIQKYFDSSVFVRVYGGGAGASSNKLICRVNWGAD